MRATTTYAELRRAAAAFAGVQPSQLELHLLGMNGGGGRRGASAGVQPRRAVEADPRRLGDEHEELTAESLDLFNRRGELAVRLVRQES